MDNIKIKGLLAIQEHSSYDEESIGEFSSSSSEEGKVSDVSTNKRAARVSINVSKMDSTPKHVSHNSSNQSSSPSRRKSVGDEEALSKIGEDSKEHDSSFVTDSDIDSDDDGTADLRRLRSNTVFVPQGITVNGQVKKKNSVLSISSEKEPKRASVRVNSNESNKPMPLIKVDLSNSSTRRRKSSSSIKEDESDSRVNNLF